MTPRPVEFPCPEDEHIDVDEDGFCLGCGESGVADYVTTVCPTSQRVDDTTLHSTRFDGDDPYTICVYCGETRDARTGRIIKPGAP